MKYLVVVCAIALALVGPGVASAQSRDPFRPPPGLNEGPSAPGAPAPTDPLPAPADRDPAIDDLPRTGQDLASPGALALFFIVLGIALRAAAASSEVGRRRVATG